MNFIYNAYNNIYTHIHSIIHSFFQMNKKAKILCIAGVFLAISIIVLQTFVITFFNYIPSILVRSAILATLCLFFFTILFGIHKSIKLEDTLQYLEETNLYNTSLKTSHDVIRAFKHDFNNIIQALGGYIANNDMEGLKVYYSQLFDECQNLNNLYTLDPSVINNPAIFRILSLKYYKATELGITMNLNIFLNFNELKMKIYEFSRILGILVDNAIEAASECETKIVNIEIRKDTVRNRQLFIVENTCLEKNIDTEKIFQKGVSSKAHNTGLGLWKVRQILNKNSNLNLYTTQNGNLFRQQLELYDVSDKNSPSPKAVISSK